MPATNPYECPRGERLGPARFRVPYGLFFTVGAIGLLGTAARQYLSAVLDPLGLLAGVLLALIATIVGRTVGTQRGARALTVTAAALLLVALLRGWIDHPGEERTMWGFACMCSGLLLGAAYPFAEPADGAGSEAASDEESMRVADERRS